MALRSENYVGISSYNVLIIILLIEKEIEFYRIKLIKSNDGNHFIKRVIPYSKCNWSSLSVEKIDRPF